MNNVEKFLSEVFGEVRVISREEELWFCASDIARVLGHRDANRVTRFLDGDKMKEKIKTRYGEQPITFINKDGLHKIFSNTRKIDLQTKRELYMFLTKEEFNEKVTISCEEVEFISKLIDSLKPLGLQIFKKQYKVFDYKIDLYLPELNIAIEYDENSHQNYTYEQQEGRQKKIEDKLGCKFIRVSDNNNLFYNIGLVIKTIYEMDHNKCNDCGCNMSLYGGEYICGNCGYVKKYNPTTMFL